MNVQFGLQPLALALALALLPRSVLAQSASPPAPPPSAGRCADSPACQDKAMLASIEAARKGRYMDASFGLLAQLGVDTPEQIPDPDIFDQWSQVWSAITGAPYPNGGKEPYSHISSADIAALKVAQARPAIAEIIERARRTRIVFLDEDHLSPRDRAFGLEVAKALKPLGYRFLAVETLTRDRDDAVSRGKMEALARDGYLRRSSGYYTNDPVFADFLRQSMGLGYRLVSYESAGFTDESDGAKRSARREQEQAENIARRVLADPGAKVLIYGGRHHAAKAPIFDPKVTESLWMAERLKRLTGIDPLVIDQVELGETPADRPDADLYEIAADKAARGSVVLTRNGKPLVIGLLAGGADLQVVHPRTRLEAGRPTWLQSLGRRPVDIPAALLPKSGKRLVQAFLAGEAEDAIAIDQVLVTAGRPAPKLMLPPNARVRYATQDDPRGR